MICAPLMPGAGGGSENQYSAIFRRVQLLTPLTRRDSHARSSSCRHDRQCNVWPSGSRAQWRQTAELRTTTSRVPHAPHGGSPARFPWLARLPGLALGAVCAGSNPARGAKSNTRANRFPLAICRLTWANVRHDPLSPSARAPGMPQDRARTMPPDVSALAGNGHQDRVLGRVLCGTNSCKPRGQAGPFTAVTSVQGPKVGSPRVTCGYGCDAASGMMASRVDALAVLVLR